MKKKGFRLTILYWLAAALAVAGCFVYAWSREPALEKSVFQLVTLGDSIFGNTRDDTSIPAILGKRLEMTAFNGALGGTCASRQHREDHLDYSLDSVSFCALSRAFRLQDFGVQKTVKGLGSSTGYFSDTISGLSALDIEQAEVILVLYGNNDYSSGRPLDTEEDPEDEYTFGGALRSGLRRLRACSPDARIVLVTPTYTWMVASGQTCEEYSANGRYLKDYVELEQQIGREEQIEVMDLYHDFLPHDTWEDWKRYTIDGIHPNEAGRQLIADRIVQYLRGEEP